MKKSNKNNKKNNKNKNTKKISTRENNNKNNIFIILLAVFILFAVFIYNYYNKKINLISNINDVDSSGRTIVMKALLNENNQLNINDIKRLIRDNRKNIDYRIRDTDSKTLLMYAVFNGDTEIIKDIAEYGNLLNETDDDGRTALHWAVFYNKYDAVVALTELGAKDYIKDNYSLTPIDIAQYEGYEEIYKYLSNL
ncbi:ankyrin repeat domain-containing protein [Brachyspira hyodysenteriae]|uniref:Ankyrin repeat-containing protein n=1 Tax=Brachyspira hyodysenteriae (strain ATCC 49526 / WA1) TaxID=565034 RepID=A0A3B6VGY5_BRAHW|nr:ankyrin repeat domain-containing protein [Brachyspira hyodysenteriae]ACN83738.1 ankyrin repeat-containing protein [Brachyspira hyodysenteriae WA1]KLI44353.1 ankyrin [Brachyspira hyodysenteriae]KLI48115.1 ankyrin [Brachyspira hyodysenteriae]KLI54875.1 ankyrin [Brachyspira hyodysenteriae]